MKKSITTLSAAVLASMMLASCGSDGYRDGTYRAEADRYDDHGWKEYLVLTVKDGAITQAEFDAVNAEGVKKTEDAGYEQAYLDADLGTWPADTAQRLEEALISTQKADEVDTVAGATWSSNSFRKLAAALEKPMEKGSREIVTVDLSDSDS